MRWSAPVCPQIRLATGTKWAHTLAGAPTRDAPATSAVRGIPRPRRPCSTGSVSHAHAGGPEAGGGAAVTRDPAPLARTFRDSAQGARAARRRRAADPAEADPRPADVRAARRGRAALVLEGEGRVEPLLAGIAPAVRQGGGPNGIRRPTCSSLSYRSKAAPRYGVAGGTVAQATAARSRRSAAFRQLHYEAKWAILVASRTAYQHHTSMILALPAAATACASSPPFKDPSLKQIARRAGPPGDRPTRPR